MYSSVLHGAVGLAAALVLTGVLPPLFFGLGAFAFFAIELGRGLRSTAYPLLYFRARILSYLVGLLSVVLPLLVELVNFAGFIGAALALLRSIVLLIQLYATSRGVETLHKGLAFRPATTLAISFGVLILAGTFFLMLPISSAEGATTGFVEALFTAASAVCITGLSVLDVGATFSIWGQAAILVLIQVGGLGVMMFAYSAMFGFRRSVSLEDKLMLSYMTNEADLSRISRAVRDILVFTFAIEGIGALLLFGAFSAENFEPGRAAWLALFHAVSAFCNAGFSLFGDSFVAYQGNLAVILPVSLLVLLGGISFPVLLNLREVLFARRQLARGRRQRPRVQRASLSLNSKIVLAATLILVLVAFLLTYILEFRSGMADLAIGDQYLVAFFQAMTIRTAGFNSIDIGAFGAGLSLLFMALMFIGGASGGTAGGVKVNTVVIILATLRSRFRGDSQVLLGQTAVRSSVAINSLILFFFAILVVVTGTVLLAISEGLNFLDLAFEAVSAFSTVGVSRGITADLSDAGRIIIILLMYIGRVGPLTLLSALGSREAKGSVVYPEKQVLIG